MGPCPVRSIHMAQIVSDKWDATWIDAFDKKTIFEIILAANYMDIKSLLHLGCAKIATLIKQLDQKEINRIIEEEEKYRREQDGDDVLESNRNDDFVESAVKNEKEMINVENIGDTSKEEVEIKRRCTDLIHSEQYGNDVGINEKN